MRFIETFAIAGAAVALWGMAASAEAQYPGMRGSYGPAHTDLATLQNIYVSRLKDLREEAIRRRLADGGTLSATSRAALQVKLGRINEAHVREVRWNDRFSVDATGAVVRARAANGRQNRVAGS